MEKRSFRILGMLLMLAAVSESGVIKEDPSGDGEIPLAISKDKKLGLHPGIAGSEEEGNEFGIYEYDAGANDPNASSDYDYGKPGEGSNIPGTDKDKPGIIKPEKIPPSDEKTIKKHDDFDKNLREDDVYEPFDGEENIDKSVGEDKDEDLDESHHGEDDEEEELEDVDYKKVPEEDGEEDDDKNVPDEDDEEEPGDEGDDKNVPDEDDEEEPGDEGDEKIPEEDEDKKEDVPDEDDELDKDDKNIGGGEESGFSHGGSIFETPFFNLEQVQKYFSQLERALGHVFKQTLDEALLLNGTYANTTEEEVEIDGKMYIVKKSLIKGADNHSSIYVEALSSKPKTNISEEIKDVDTNVTHT